MPEPEDSLIDDEFVATVRRDMLRFARLQLRDAELAEDAVQEALLAALQGTRGFAGRAALKTWVFSILRHKIVGQIRRDSRTTSLSALSDDESELDRTLDALFKANAHWQPAARPAAWGDPEAALRERDFWAVFDVCLTHLPERTARVFMMREFLELETGEICDALGISASHCGVMLYRARSGLRHCLEDGWFVPGEARC